MSAIPHAPDFDYLALEGAIAARLEAEVPELAAVRSEASLEGVKGSQLPTPSALVLWAGDRVSDDHNPEASLVEQTWVVCLVVKHANDKAGSKTRAAAGPLVTKVIRALRGYEVNADIGPLKWVEAVEPELADGGVLYVPLAFQARFSL